MMIEPYSSQCMGCDKYFRHSPSQEDVAERAYCDVCLKTLGIPPRGTSKSWDDANRVEAVA